MRLSTKMPVTFTGLDIGTYPALRAFRPGEDRSKLACQKNNSSSG